MNPQPRTRCFTLLLVFVLPFAVGHAPNRADDPSPTDSAPAAAVSSRTVSGAALPDVATFPKLRGTLTELLGSTNGYIPPRNGLATFIDFAELLKEPNKQLNHGALDFGWRDKLDPEDPRNYGYIPLPGKLELQNVHYYGNGVFDSARFVAELQDLPGTHRITLDVKWASTPQDDPAANDTRVWIVIETGGRIAGVAIIDCKADGRFPDRKPPAAAE